ncbi:hypothetical protein EOD41_03555 [Mucilaginibacter limnophilus]|uniref:Alpha fucosidase A-like C-terminal domain-containing protein n=1 Tax=Mucilaginibacter limnophilus TaxID=1932778 RepID=A0A3S2VAS7_9SPHI|nr:hypothetical protein [Mucilaginibacter limnophilus]RVU03024.1 hypothetical protein EOD41_03555 [Mucilaginibacter limnophilus]
MGSFHNVGELFNTDISGGLPAVIVEMLIYADEDTIKLLPALPADWKTGSLHGALLKGNILVDELAWNKKEINFILTSSANKKISLEFPEAVRRIKLNGDKLSPGKIKKNKYLLQLNKAEKVSITLML